MPRFPELSANANSIRQLTFSAFGDRITALRKQGRLIPLHLGDTYKMPPAAALEAAGLDRLETHLYGPTGGLTELVEALAADEGVAPEQIRVSTGATGALSQVAHTLFSPGEEVIVLTPTWPLIFGILQSVGVTPVEVAVGPDGWPEDSADALIARLEAQISERTSGLYFCDPNNPVGFVYPEAHLAALQQLAEKHDLWLLVDEAYHDLVFDGSRTTSLGHLPRTVRVRSFSKTWAMAGHRVGYIIAPPDLSALLLRVGVHMTYHATVPGQQIALAAMRGGEAYNTDLRQTYQRAADQASAALQSKVPFHRPQAGYYLFLDLRDRCADAEALVCFLRDLTETGVTLSPGQAFGEQFARFTRLCFTAVPPERLAEGLEHLARALD